MIDQLIQEITEERYALLTGLACGALTALAFIVATKVIEWRLRLPTKGVRRD